MDVARLVASAHGFNVDLEPGAPGYVKLTADHPNGAVLHYSGATVNEAAAKLIKGLSHG